MFIHVFVIYHICIVHVGVRANACSCRCDVESIGFNITPVSICDVGTRVV